MIKFNLNYKLTSYESYPTYYNHPKKKKMRPNMHSSYGSLDDGYNSPNYYNDDEDDHLLHRVSLSPLSSQLPKREQNRRWSVIDKLNNRHYLRIRNCKDFYDMLTLKFLFNLLMLFTFLYLLYFAIHTLFIIDLNNNHKYDYIIIGGGPAGILILLYFAFLSFILLCVLLVMIDY